MLDILVTGVSRHQIFLGLGYFLPVFGGWENCW